ncbi:trypsin-like peptidase domain-containing protein [Streptomyces sp. NPDC046985]|uniref:trypsin-like serine peptidase n=1 Tax=Streptomyces sp. NPDC046985 TaxID=3155377 RepID=UPI0033F8002D
MKRTTGNRRPARHIRRGPRKAYSALVVGLVLVAATSASVATADDGPGPLGVTSVATATAQNARVGALFSADKASALAGNHFCTASVVHSPRHDLVLTAAHCLTEGADLVFAPGYRDGAAPYGVWKVVRHYVSRNWSGSQDEDSDVAFAVIAPQGGQNVEDAVGANQFATGTATGAKAVTVTGYPRDAEAPVACTNMPSAHSGTQQRIDCPAFTGGTSGSPWVDRDRHVIGVLGGHEQGGSTPDTSYSVVFGAEAAALYGNATAEN